jgi:hypothetical protein
MDDVGIFYGHLVYFTAIWCIYGHLVYSLPCGMYMYCSFGVGFPFWYVVTRKIWQPCCYGYFESVCKKPHLFDTRHLRSCVSARKSFFFGTARVARFLLVHYNKHGKTYQMSTKFNKRS